MLSTDRNRLILCAWEEKTKTLRHSFHKECQRYQGKGKCHVDTFLVANQGGSESHRSSDASLTLWEKVQTHKYKPLRIPVVHTSLKAYNWEGELVALLLLNSSRQTEGQQLKRSTQVQTTPPVTSEPLLGIWPQNKQQIVGHSNKIRIFISTYGLWHC